MAGGKTPLALQFFVQTLLQQLQTLVQEFTEKQGLPTEEDDKETIFELVLKRLKALQNPLAESKSLCEKLVGNPKQALSAKRLLQELEYTVGRSARFLAWVEDEAKSSETMLLWRISGRDRLTFLEKTWLDDFPPVDEELKRAVSYLEVAVEEKEDDTGKTGPRSSISDSSSCICLLAVVVLLFTGMWFAIGSSTCKCKELLPPLQVQEQCPVAEASPSSNLLSLETLCSFNCSSIQVQQAAMSFYLNKHREVQSVSILNSVASGPWPNTCDIAFTWNRRLYAGGASGEDFRKFRFEEVTGDVCNYVPFAMGFHLTGHKAVDEDKLIFQGIGKCTGKIDVADSDAVWDERAATWNGRGIWPVCRNGEKWSCVGRKHQDRYAHLEVPEWHGGGCKCESGCVENWAEHIDTWWSPWA